MYVLKRQGGDAESRPVFLWRWKIRLKLSKQVTIGVLLVIFNTAPYRERARKIIRARD